MAKFSARNGYEEKKEFQVEKISTALKNRIWNYYASLTNTDITNPYSNGAELILDRLGQTCSQEDEFWRVREDLSKLQKWFNSAKWFEVYDFIEMYLEISPKPLQRKHIDYFNKILIEENAGYRIVGLNIVAISNPAELETINLAQETEFENVNRHLKKAVELFSKRPKPDYENTIKESISAVEAMCCLITGTQATLGKALKCLKENGIEIHPSMQSAFSSLYGYTSDQSGIRHGGRDYKNVPIEDAMYMLVTCSAFVNYLVEKWRKIKG